MYTAVPLTFLQIVAPLMVALGFIAACSLLKEPGRRHFSAIIIAGAGAAYLNGGLGAWEFAFCALVTFIATSSAGCAICDLGLAAWYFLGAPSIYTWLGKRNLGAGT